MIGAYLGRSGKSDALLGRLSSIENINVERENNLIAWCTNGISHEAIIRLPFYLASKELTLVCGVVGKIFIGKDFRKILQQEISRDVNSLTSAEVLAYGYLLEGEEYFNFIDGEFAAFLYDPANAKFIIRTDLIGIQRLYYTSGGDSELVCNDLKCVLEFNDTREICEKCKDDYFYFGYVPAPRTIYAGVYKTTPDYWRILELKTWQHKQKRMPNENTAELSAFEADLESTADLEKILISELDESVKRRLGSSRSASVLLSSGYDSSLCAARLKTLCDDVYSYTIGFRERKENENNLAAKIAAHLGLEHRDIMLSSEQMIGSMCKWVERHAEPWAHPNGLSTYIAYGEIRGRAGNSDVFDGGGGDSLFRDFSRIGLKIATGQLLYSAPSFLKMILQRLEREMPEGHLSDLLRKINRVSVNGSIGSMVFHNNWKGDHYRYLTGREFVFNETAPGQKYYSGGSTLEEKYLSYFSSVGFDASLGRSVLEGNLQGMRATFPLEDYRLISFIKNLPRKMKYRVGRKRYLQENIAHKYIPEKYFSAKKKAMDPSLGIVLRSPDGIKLLDRYFSPGSVHQIDLYKRSYVEAIVKKFKAGDLDHATRIWNILVFEIWADSYLR